MGQRIAAAEGGFTKRHSKDGSGVYCMAIIFGINAVAEALKANPGRIERLCIERRQKNSRVQDIVDAGRSAGVQLSFEDRSWLDRKAGGERHQGVLCYLAEAETLDTGAILAAARTPGLLVVLDGIEDPHNLGAILRSAEVSGVDGVFIPERRSAGLSATVVKASAGASSYLRIARVPNTARLLDELKEHGYWVVGLDASARQSLREADFRMPTVVVLGSEGSGLHRLVREKCDFLVSIPVRGKVGSHNVSVAAGIALYEAVRQRGEKTSA